MGLKLPQRPHACRAPPQASSQAACRASDQANDEAVCGVQLVAELTRLGATVIAADASSLILGTGKHDVPGAVGCVRPPVLHIHRWRLSSSPFSTRSVFGHMSRGSVRLPNARCWKLDGC